MALATADAGRPAVRADGPAQGTRAGRLHLLHQPRQPEGRGACRQSHAALALSLEDRSGGRSASKGRSSRSRTRSADAYFASRSRDSQLGAWASYQSRPLDERDTFERRYRGDDPPLRGSSRCPVRTRWSGFRADPGSFEFWSRPPHRLHERRLFTRSTASGWREGLLYP